MRIISADNLWWCKYGAPLRIETQECLVEAETPRQAQEIFLLWLGYQPGIEGFSSHLLREVTVRKVDFWVIQQGDVATEGQIREITIKVG